MSEFPSNIPSEQNLGNGIEVKPIEGVIASVYLHSVFRMGLTDIAESIGTDPQHMSIPPIVVLSSEALGQLQGLNTKTKVNNTDDTSPYQIGFSPTHRIFFITEELVKLAFSASFTIPFDKIFEPVNKKLRDVFMQSSRDESTITPQDNKIFNIFRSNLVDAILEVFGNKGKKE